MANHSNRRILLKTVALRIPFPWYAARAISLDIWSRGPLHQQLTAGGILTQISWGNLVRYSRRNPRIEFPRNARRNSVLSLLLMFQENRLQKFLVNLREKSRENLMSRNFSRDILWKKYLQNVRNCGRNTIKTQENSRRIPAKNFKKICNFVKDPSRNSGSKSGKTYGWNLEKKCWTQTSINSFRCGR